ncbi:hypothetical protein BB560_001496 [Smittium megazygosporum]|uniref:DMAP1-binding domain-containing protein n=1 Tax=Smittium megazygosporum TaxID=133381 RepID=A0A2T9ZHC3_9FUNG|nr:hypothetical protein BB560_001496 [Smittium megazygosporum]
MNFDDNEYTEAYLESLNKLIKDYDEGYLTELGYEKRKIELTRQYELLVSTLNTKNQASNNSAKPKSSFDPDNLPLTSLNKSSDSIHSSKSKLSQKPSKSELINSLHRRNPSAKSNKISANVSSSQQHKSIIKINSIPDSVNSNDFHQPNIHTNDNFLEVSSNSYNIDHPVVPNIKGYSEISNGKFGNLEDSSLDDISFNPKGRVNHEKESHGGPSDANIEPSIDQGGVHNKNLDLDFSESNAQVQNESSLYKHNSLFRSTAGKSIVFNVKKFPKAANGTKKKYTHVSKFFDDISDDSDDYSFNTGHMKPSVQSIYGNIESGRSLLDEQFFNSLNDNESVYDMKTDSIYIKSNNLVLQNLKKSNTKKSLKQPTNIPKKSLFKSNSKGKKPYAFSRAKNQNDTSPIINKLDFDDPNNNSELSNPELPSVPKSISNSVVDEKHPRLYQNSFKKMPPSYNDGKQYSKPVQSKKPTSDASSIRSQQKPTKKPHPKFDKKSPANSTLHPVIPSTLNNTSNSRNTNTKGQLNKNNFTSLKNDTNAQDYSAFNIELDTDLYLLDKSTVDLPLDDIFQRDVLKKPSAINSICLESTHEDINKQPNAQNEQKASAKNDFKDPKENSYVLDSQIEFEYYFDQNKNSPKPTPGLLDNPKTLASTDREPKVQINTNKDNTTQNGPISSTFLENPNFEYSGIIGLNLTSDVSSKKNQENPVSPVTKSKKFYEENLLSQTGLDFKFSSNIQIEETVANQKSLASNISGPSHPIVDTNDANKLKNELFQDFALNLNFSDSKYSSAINSPMNDRKLVCTDNELNTSDQVPSGFQHSPDIHLLAKPRNSSNRFGTMISDRTGSPAPPEFDGRNNTFGQPLQHDSFLFSNETHDKTISKRQERDSSLLNEINTNPKNSAAPSENQFEQFSNPARNFASSRAVKNQSRYFPPGMHFETTAVFQARKVQNELELDLEVDRKISTTFSPNQSSYRNEILGDLRSPSQEKPKSLNINHSFNPRYTIRDQSFIEESFDKILNQKKSPSTEPKFLADLSGQPIPKTPQSAPIHGLDGRRTSSGKNFSNIKTEFSLSRNTNSYPSKEKPKNIISFLEYNAKQTPNYTAYTCIDNKGNQIGSLSWKQLISEVSRLVSVIKKLPGDISKGDRIALVYRKYEILDFVCALYACFAIGIIAVPLVSFDSYAELAYILRSTGSKLVLTTDLNILSLNKDLSSLMPSTPQLDGVDQTESNNFAKIWPRHIPWVSAGINVNNLHDIKNRSSFGPQPSIMSLELSQDDVAYIEFGKSGNGELKGIMISHAQLVQQCELWAESTFTDSSVSKNPLIDVNVPLSGSSLNKDSVVQIQKVGSPVLKSSQDKRHIIFENQKALKSSNSDSLNFNESARSFMNMLSNSGNVFRNLKGKKSEDFENYKVINKPSAPFNITNPNASSPSNSAYTHKKNQYSQSSFEDKRNISSENGNGHFYPKITHPNQNSLDLSSDSEATSDLESDFGFNISRTSKKILKSFKKETILTNVEPRQQYGLVYGVFTGTFCGNHTIHVSSILCEDPASYLYLLVKHKVNILSTSGYKELRILLDSILSDPKKILKSSYFKSNNGSFTMPNLFNLRLILVDTMEIDLKLHQKFTSAVLMMFGCPVRQILQSQNRPVLTPILTLSEFGGFLLAIKTGVLPSAQHKSKRFPDTKENESSELDFSTDVSGLDFVFLDRHSLHNNAIKVYSKRNPVNSVSSSLGNTQPSQNTQHDTVPTVDATLFGPASAGTDLVIVDPDSRFICEDDEIGEVWIRSDNSGNGFWGLPKLSTSIFEARYNYNQKADITPKTQFETLTSRLSETVYLRTGIMGAVIKGQILILGYYEDRLRCMTMMKKNDNRSTDVADISFHYSLAIVNNLKSQFSYWIQDCIFIELVSNNAYLSILMVESNSLNNNSYSESNYNSFFNKIFEFLYEKHGIVLFGIVVSKPGSLPRAYQYGHRKINVSLAKQSWEEGKIMSFYTGLNFRNLFLALPSDLQKILNSKVYFPPDPSIHIFGPWTQITGFEPLSGVLDDNSSIDLLKFESLTELLVYRAQTSPSNIAYIQHDANGDVVKTVTYLKLLYQVSFVVLFLMDKLRVKPGEYVLISIMSGIESVIVIQACLAIGAIPISIAPIIDEAHLYEELPLILSTVVHFKIRSILVNSELFGETLLNSKTAYVAFQSLGLIVCNMSRIEKGGDSDYANNGARNSAGNSSMNTKLRNNKDRFSQNNTDLGPVPRLVLGQDSFKPYKRGPSGGNMTALVMLYKGIIPESPNLVSLTHKNIIHFCSQQKIDFQMYHQLPIISSVRSYNGYGLLQLAFTGLFCFSPTVVLSSNDYFSNPSIWLSLISKYKIKDVFTTLPMLEHMLQTICVKQNTQSQLKNVKKLSNFSSVQSLANGNLKSPLLGPRLSVSNLNTEMAVSLDGSRVSLDCVSNFIISTEGRVPAIHINKVEDLLYRFGLRPKVLNTVYGNLMNMCISSRSYLDLDKLELNLDIQALQHKKVVMLPQASSTLGVQSVQGSQGALFDDQNYDQFKAMVLQDSGKVSGATMVAIVDHETKRPVEVGNIGEIWIYSECNSQHIERPSPNVYKSAQISGGYANGKIPPLANTPLIREKLYSQMQFTNPSLSKIVTDDPSLDSLMFVRTGDFGFLHIDTSKPKPKSKNSSSANLRQITSKTALNNLNISKGDGHTGSNHISNYSNIHISSSDSSGIEEPYLFVVGNCNDSFFHKDLLHFYCDLEATVLSVNEFSDSGSYFEECVVVSSDKLFKTSPEITYCHDFNKYNSEMGEGSLDSEMGPKTKIVVFVSVSDELQSLYVNRNKSIAVAQQNSAKKTSKPSIMNLNSIYKHIGVGSGSGKLSMGIPKNSLTSKNQIPGKNINASNKNELDMERGCESVLGNLLSKIVTTVLDRHRLAINQIVLLTPKSLPKRKAKLFERRQLLAKEMFFNRPTNVLESYLL